jgi:hypothetical protein
MLRTPRMMGSVSVGSGCANVVSVRNDSESNGVGPKESLPRTIVVTTKKGSCESGGAMMDGRGRQLYSLNNCFLRAVSYDEAINNPSEILQRTYYFNTSLRMKFLEIFLLPANSCLLHFFQDPL